MRVLQDYLALNKRESYNRHAGHVRSKVSHKYERGHSLSQNATRAARFSWLPECVCSGAWPYSNTPRSTGSLQVLALLFAPVTSLARTGDAHLLAIFGDRAAGNIQPLRLQPPHEFVVAERF